MMEVSAALIMASHFTDMVGAGSVGTPEWKVFIFAAVSSMDRGFHAVSW